MIVLLLIGAIHAIVALTAARWWMKDLLLAFDAKFNLPHCKESDFFFFCWSWSIVLFLMGLYWVWERTNHFHGAWFRRFAKKS